MLDRLLKPSIIGRFNPYIKNNDTTISVESKPFEVITDIGVMSTIIEKVDITIQLIPHKKATANVKLINNNNMVVKTERFSIEGDDYDNWGDDDDYILELILGKLGLELKQV